MKSEIYLIFEIRYAVRSESEYFPSGNKIEIFQSLTGKSPITETDCVAVKVMQSVFLIMCRRYITFSVA